MARKHRIGTGKKRKPMTLAHRKAIGRGLARVKGETTDYDPYEKKGRKPGKGSHKASGTSRKMHDAEKAAKARKNAPKTVESVTAKKLPKNGVSGGGKQANPKFLDKDAIRNEPGYGDFLDMQREMVNASPEARAAFMNQVEHARKAAEIDHGPDPENGEFGRNRAAQRRALHLEAMAEDMGLIKVENTRRAKDQADAIDNRAEEAKKRNDQRRKQGVKDRKASRARAEKQRAEQEKREQEAQRAAEREAQKATAAEREAQRREAKIKQREKQEQALERAASQKAAARRAEYANWDDSELGEAHAAIMDKWGGDLDPANDDNYDFGVIAEREHDRKRVNDLLDEMDDRAAERAGYTDNRDYGTLAEKGQGHSATELGAAEQDYFAQIAGDRQAETELRDYLDQARQAHAARQAEYKAELDKLTAPQKGDKSDEAKAYRALKRKHDEARRLSNGAKKKHAALETRMRETYPDYDRPFYHTDDDELAELRDALSSVPDRDADTEQLLEQVQEELRYRDPAEIDGWADKNLREMTNLGKKYGHHMSEQEIVDRMALAGNERERAWNHSTAYQDKYEEWLTGIASNYATYHAGAGGHEDQFDGNGRTYIESRLGVNSLADVTNAMHAAKLRGEGKDFLNTLGFIPTEANFRRHLRGEALKPYSEDSLKDVTHMGGTAKRRTKAEMNLARALNDATADMTPTEKRQYMAERKRRAAERAAEESRAAEARRAENKQRTDNALKQLGDGWSDDLGAIQLDGTNTRIHTNEDGTFTVKDRDTKGKGRTYDTLEKAAAAARRKNKQATNKPADNTEQPAEKRTVTTEDGREIDMSAIPGAGKDTDKGMSDRVKAILAEQAARRAESDTPESTAEKTARENGTTPSAEKAAKAVAKAETTKAKTDADKPAKRGRPKLNGPTLGERRAEATREQADRINTLKANRPATGDPARAQWDYDMATARIQHAEAVERFERDRMADLAAQNKPLTSVKKNISKAQAAQTKAREDRDNALAKARAKHGDDAAETIRTTGGYVAPTKKKRAPKRDTKATKKRDADTKDTQGAKKRETWANRRNKHIAAEKARVDELKANKPERGTDEHKQWQRDYAQAQLDLIDKRIDFEKKRKAALEKAGKATNQPEKTLDTLEQKRIVAEGRLEKAKGGDFKQGPKDPKTGKRPTAIKQSPETVAEMNAKRRDSDTQDGTQAAKATPAPANKVDVKPEEYEGKDTVLVWDGKRVHTFSAHDPNGKPDVKRIDRDAEAARAEVNDMAKKRQNSSVIMAVKRNTFGLSKQSRAEADEYNASVDKLLQDVQKATEKRSAEIGEEKRKERFDQARKAHDEADARRAEAVERSRNVPPVDTSDLDLNTPLGKAERDYREADRAAKVAEAMRDAIVAKGDQDTYQAHMAAADARANNPESRKYHNERVQQTIAEAQDAEVRADKRVEEAHATLDKARTARDKARHDAEAMADMSGGNGLQATTPETPATPAPQGKRHKKGTPFTTENLKEGETLDERGNILRGNFKIISTDDGYRYMETGGNERMSKNFTSKTLDKMRKDVDALTARNTKAQDQATPETRETANTPETTTVDGADEINGRLWEKNGKSRTYINGWENAAGFEIDRYKTGNIKTAYFNGHKISNNRATQATAGRRVYVDNNTGELHVDGLDKLTIDGETHDVFDKIAAAIKASGEVGDMELKRPGTAAPDNAPKPPQRRAANMTEAERNTVIIAMNNRLIDGKIDAEEYERTVWDMEHPDGPDYDNRPMPEDGESDALHHVSNPDARIQITHSEDEGTLVHGTERDDNVGTAMRANGFKWSRNLKAWYRPRSRDKMPDEYKISRLRKALQEQGLDVGLDIDRRMGDAQHREDNRAQRSADRIEALGEKAQRKQAAAGAAWNAHFARVDALPPGGEPIKVGHHSEKRHRRDLDRAWKSLGRAVTADEAAGEVQRRIEAAESHRDQRNRPYTVANRIEKLEKKIKKQRDYLNGAPIYRGGARRKPLTGDSRVRALNEIDTDMQDLQVQRAIFDQLKADGKVVDIHDLRPGDKIGHFDQWLPVEKVNKASVTVQGGRKFKQGEVTKVKKITDEELAELNNAKKARKKKSDNGPHIVGEPIRKNHVLTDGTEKFNRGKLTRNGFTIKSTKGMYDGMYGGMFDVTGTPDKKFYVATPNALHSAKSLDEAREVIDRAAEDLNIDTSYMGHNELIGTPDAKLFEIALNPNRDPMGKARDILRGREQQGRLTYPDTWQAIAWQNSDFLSMSSEELQNIANGGGERAEAARRYLIGKFPGMFKDNNTGGGTLNGQHGLA